MEDWGLGGVKMGGSRWGLVCNLGVLGIKLEGARMGGCLGWRVQLGERGGSLGLWMYDMRWVGEVGHKVAVAVRVCGIGR